MSQKVKSETSESQHQSSATQRNLSLGTSTLSGHIPCEAMAHLQALLFRQ